MAPKDGSSTARSANKTPRASSPAVKGAGAKPNDGNKSARTPGSKDGKSKPEAKPLKVAAAA